MIVQRAYESWPRRGRRGHHRSARTILRALEKMHANTSPAANRALDAQIDKPLRAPRFGPLPHSAPVGKVMPALLKFKSDVSVSKVSIIAAAAINARNELRLPGDCMVTSRNDSTHNALLLNCILEDLANKDHILM